MVATIVSSSHLPYFREEPTEEPPPAPRPLFPGQLPAEQLARAFRFLRLDYMATIAGTATLPNPERFEVVRQRLGEYSDALADALGDAADDAATLMRGQRSRHGGW
jgi:hypothetical protein